MSTSTRFFRYVSLGLFVASLAPEAHAASNRIFMAPNGNNASDCANPLTPCLTFAGAIAQVNPGGEVIAEATGGYGPLNITQAVTISGPLGVVLYSGLTATVNAPGATVVLRGLTIDGTGAAASGINVVAVGSLFVESCVITGFAGGGPQGNGIYFASDGQLFVKDTVIRGNSNGGIWLAPVSGTVRASINHCKLDANQFGLVSPGLGGTPIVTVQDSVISGNSSIGVSAVSAGSEFSLEGCVIANNGFRGISSVSSTGSIIRVSNCTVTDNVTGLFASFGGTLLTRTNNTVEGNGTDGTFTGTYSAK